MVDLQEIALSVFICLGGEFPRRDIIMSRDVRPKPAGDRKFEGGRLQMNMKRSVFLVLVEESMIRVAAKCRFDRRGANRIQIGLYHSNNLNGNHDSQVSSDYVDSESIPHDDWARKGTRIYEPHHFLIRPDSIMVVMKRNGSS